MENPKPSPKNEEQTPKHSVSTIKTPEQPQDQKNQQEIKDPEEQQHQEADPEEQKEPEQTGMMVVSTTLLLEQNTETHVAILDSEPDPVLQNPPVTSPTSQRRGRPVKQRKKTMPIRKRQAFAKRIDYLSKIFKPIPFSPKPAVAFSTHEKLLKRIGLWDFVHVDFDKIIRTDLIMQLLVSHSPQTKCRYINGERITVTRADLARALRLPAKKDKMNVVEGEGDEEPVSDEAKAFVEHLVSNWILLHDDTWILPNEVVNWTKVIKEGHPEKVDWASLIWFMVEKELSQGQNLSHCYYASHLQRLIKMKRETLFLTEPVVDTTMKEGDEDDIAEIKVCESEPGADIEIINNEGPSNFFDICPEEGEMLGSDDVSIVDGEVKMEPSGGDLKMGGSGDVRIVDDEVRMESRLGDLKMGGSNDVTIGEDNVKMEQDVAVVKIGDDYVKMGPNVADLYTGDDDAKMGLQGADVKIDGSADVKIGVSDCENVGGSANVKIGGSDDEKVGATNNEKIGAGCNDVKIGDTDVNRGLDGGDINIGGSNDVKISDDDGKMGLDGGELKIGGSDDGDDVNFVGYDVNMGTNDGAVNIGDNDVKKGMFEEDGSDVQLGNNDGFTVNECAEPNVELNLGQNNFIKEELVQDDSMNFEECEVQEAQQWFLNNNNNMTTHILQPCNQSRLVARGNVEKQQEDEEDQVIGFSLLPKCRNAGITSSENLIEEVEDHSLMVQFTSRAEPIPAMSGPSGFGNISKREIDHNQHQGNHKRLRMEEQWDDDKLPEPSVCMEMAEQWMAKSRLSYGRQEQANRNTDAHQEYLMNEIHQRDAMIEHVNKVRFEEQQRKQMEVYRLNRELFDMANLVQSYRKALKETRRSFAEYRALWQYPEEPLYKDVEGGGGLVVTGAEIERERVKREREEEEKRNVIELMIKKFDVEWTGKFKEYANEADMIDGNLLEAEKKVKMVKEMRSTRAGLIGANPSSE